MVALLVYYHNRVSTDDAEVDGHIVPSPARFPERSSEVLIHDNETVKAGQVLVRIDPRDYQARVDQAKAALALAQARARGAGVGVPLTQETTDSTTSGADAQLAARPGELRQVQVHLSNGTPRRNLAMPVTTWQRSRPTMNAPRRTWPA